MSRRGGPKKKVKSESGAAVVAAPAAATPAAAAVVAAVVASSPSPAPAKKLRRRGSEIVYPPGRTVVVFSSLTYTPMLAYDCALLMDKGFVPSRWACARLHDEALYLETCKARFELMLEDGFFVLSRLRDPALVSVPVSEELKERLAKAESWLQVVWGAHSVQVAGVMIDGLLALRWEKPSNIEYA